jgi:hypothetical protein
MLSVTYDFWIKAKRIYEGGLVEGSSLRNYQLTMPRYAAMELYQELKKEFG